MSERPWWLSTHCWGVDLIGESVLAQRRHEVGATFFKLLQSVARTWEACAAGSREEELSFDVIKS